MRFEANKGAGRAENLSKPEIKIWESVHLGAGDIFTYEISSRTAIFFIVKGSVLFKMGREENGIVENGQMLLVPFGCPLWSEALEDAHLMICRLPSEIIFPRDWFSPDITAQQSGVDPIYKVLTIHTITSSFLSFIHTCMEDGTVESSFYEFTQKKIILLFSYIYPKQELVAFFYPVIGEDIHFKKIVIDNFLKVKNIEELSALTHLSVSGFRKRFVRSFNESPAQWVARKKAEAIRTDILTRTMTLKEIACKYQFTSYGCFFDFCKTQFGIPPSKIESLSE